LYIFLVRDIYRSEGFFALWRGVGATIVGVMPARAIYFACYNHGKTMFTDMNQGNESSLVHVSAAVSAGTF
jgi:solute carrier family 25, member 33/36